MKGEEKVMKDDVKKYKLLDLKYRGKLVSGKENVKVVYFGNNVVIKVNKSNK